MRAASRVSSVFGLAGLLAALLLVGGPAPVGGVMAALNAETQSTVAGSSIWRVIPSGTGLVFTAPSTYAFSLGNNVTQTFTLQNTGTVALNRVAEVRVTQVGGAVNWRLVSPTGTCVPAACTNNNTTVKSFTNWSPAPGVGASLGTWSIIRAGGGTRTFQIQITVSSSDVTAGTTNG